MRYLWRIPAAVIAWYAAGFAATWLDRLPGDAATLVPATATRVDLLVLGGFTGGVAAGLFVGRLRIAVPLVLAEAVGVWFWSGHSLDQRDLLITLLAATALGAIFGAFGGRSSVMAAVALAVPVAWYAVRPAARLEDWRWLWQLNGLLVAAGLALLLYVCCWRRGWRSAYFWPLVAAAYVLGFGIVEGVQTLARSTDRPVNDAADTATQAFFHAFEPVLREYWPWMVLAVLLAIPMTALKVRALPPPPPPPDPYADRSNDAVLPDDLDWIDRDEPRRRLLPRRQPVP
jgi:hypothetical protein